MIDNITIALFTQIGVDAHDIDYNNTTNMFMCISTDFT